MKFFALLCMASMALATPLGKLAPSGNDGLIVGGEPAGEKELPFQVSLQKSSHFCGAAIYNKRWIVTAAHCISGTAASSLRVRIGTTAHNSGGSMHTIERVIPHPKYDSWTIDNDIALLKTTQDMVLAPGSSMDGIPLVDAGFNLNGKDVVVSGWGYLKEGGGSLPTKLMKVTVPIVDNAKCNEAYNGQISDQMFCAGIPDGGKDACQGDSGGPVTVMDGSVRKLAGVVSWGYGCARPKYPGVYTSIPALRQWLDDNMD